MKKGKRVNKTEDIITAKRGIEMTSRRARDRITFLGRIVTMTLGPSRLARFRRKKGKRRYTFTNNK